MKPPRRVDLHTLPTLIHLIPHRRDQNSVFVPDNFYFFNPAHKLSKKGEWAYLGKKKAQRLLSAVGIQKGK